VSNNILSDVRFLFDGRDLSGDGNQIQFAETFPMLDATRFTDTAKVNRPGLPEGKFSYSGYSQFGLGLVEETIANHKAAANVPILASIHGNAGDRCHFFKAAISSSEVIKGKVNEICGFMIDGVTSAGDAGILDGTVLESGKTAHTTAGQSTGVQAGAVLSTQSAYAIIQVLAITATTLTLKIQSSATQGGSYTDRFTQSGITAVGGFYLVPLPGAITDTWWRVDWSGTFTSFQAAVAVAIR
jgi:hypothetical protein